MKQYTVVMINGRAFDLEAGEMIDEEGFIHFYIGDDEVGVFKKDNIAGWFVDEYEDPEE